jgi:predicted O-methyltransferase YrrM
MGTYGGGMISTLDSDPVASILATLYANARGQLGGRPSGGGGSGAHRDPQATAQERSDAAEDIYMPVDPMAGRLMYSLIRASRPQVVVEFGMSYGISTLHSAAAVRDNGVGHVYTTEMSAKKIAAATRTFADAGVDDLVTILDGDARETLQSVDGDVGFILLDGWKEMYLPVLQLLEPRLPAGAIVLADNTEHAGTETFVEYVRDPANGYTSVNFPGKANDTMELATRN